MTILCWIDVPPDWRCEIKTSDGVVRPWNQDRPIASTCKFRAWDPRRPRDHVNDPWMVPGDYAGPTTTEVREWSESGRRRNEYVVNRPGHHLYSIIPPRPKKQADQ